MGGIGSGRRIGREPLRLVERSFVLDIGQVVAWGLVPGTRGDLTLTAALIVWPVQARFLIRRVDGFVVTMWFDRAVGGGSAEIAIGVPSPGSRRRPYFVCPGPSHRANAPALAARLYWPVGDMAGFACRVCHKLAYRSSQTRRVESLWMRRLRIAAGR